MGIAMLTLEQISDYFPAPLRAHNPQGVLVEYLQHELLDSLFKNQAAAALSFIGGTAIRILHQSYRFSEDLDFDNFGLSFGEFETMLKTACRDMEYKGFLVEYRVVERGAYHCYIRFPDILFKSGISTDKNQKILIRIDTEAKEKLYEPQRFILNKFAVYRQIYAAPATILLSQKMMTVVERKREKGRDLFDVSLLLGLAKPDFAYISKCMDIEKTAFLMLFNERLQKLDLNFLANDVEPFLFSSAQKERILTFREYWESVKSF
jgi:predicted nucleotidyltransferase component of viral defense system